MGKPYSNDLRLRVLKALDGGMNKMTAHKTFCVSRSTIDHWIALRARTGSVGANTTYRPPLTDAARLLKSPMRRCSAPLRANMTAALWHKWPPRGTSERADSTA